MKSDMCGVGGRRNRGSLGQGGEEDIGKLLSSKIC